MSTVVNLAISLDRLGLLKTQHIVILKIANLQDTSFHYLLSCISFVVPAKLK